MVRTLSIVAAFLALAGAAHAQSITVSLIGKDAQTIHRDIVRAAEHVCDESQAGSAALLDVMGSCVRDTVARAEAQVPAVLARAAAERPANAPTQAMAAQDINQH